MDTSTSTKAADSPGSLEDSLKQKANKLGVELEPWYHSLEEQSRIRFLQDKIRDREELSRKDEELSRKDEELSRKDEELLRNSLEFAYGKSKENFRQLPLQINTAVTPSVQGNTRRVTIKDHQGNDKTVDLKIPSTNRICCVGKGMWAKIEEVKIPRTNSFPIRSNLAANFHDTGTERVFTYANEFDVQSLCRDMVRDALRALGLTEEYVRSHLEISIYLMKPDIVLVLRHEGRIMFAIEVKSPEVKRDEVFGSKQVGGQIWSYLYAMKAAGDEHPMGAIMTYKKIVLVTLDDLSNDETHAERVATTQRALSTDLAQQPQQEKKEEACHERRTTPEKKPKPVSESNSEYNKEMREEVYEEESLDRQVYYSRVHEEGEVFPCLLQALHIAFQKATQCSTGMTHLPRVTHGESLGRRLVFKVGESSFDWVKTPSHIKDAQKEKSEFRAIFNDKLPAKKSIYFYVLGKLGEGRKASVYLCCNTSGHVCAIKEYYLKPSAAATQDARDEEENRRRADLLELAEYEESLWKDLYGGRFSARVTYLGGKPTILMPYGHEIECDSHSQSPRWEKVPAVRAELQRFAKKGHKYKKSDIRWRHVLFDFDNKTFLCDLESLEQITGSEDRDQVVYEQLEVLLRPLIKQDQALDIDGTLEWLRNPSNLDDVMSLIESVDTLRTYFQNPEGGVAGVTNDKSVLRETIESLFPQKAAVKDLSVQGKVGLYMMTFFRISAGRDSKPPSPESSEKSIPLLEREIPEANSRPNKRIKTSMAD